MLKFFCEKWLIGIANISVIKVTAQNRPSWAKQFSGPLRATDGELMQMCQIREIISGKKKDQIGQLVKKGAETQLSSKTQTANVEVFENIK